MGIKILQRHSVSPSEGGAAEHSLPLLYFDMVWLQTPPTETLYFYVLKCSESHFLDTIVLKLKHSLSIALKHYLPLASNIIFPLTSAAMPLSRYTVGDSVALTIAASDADFANLTSNASKAADQFHQFVPQLRPAVYSSDDIKFGAIAIQVTLFPNKGMCIGLTHHHAICDATALFAFLRTWASIHKSDGGQLQILPPFYGRDSVQDADELTIFSWNIIKMNRPVLSPTLSLALHKVRATFIISDVQIEKLKSSAIARPSTFVAMCAHLWSCLAQSAAAAGEAVDDDEPEYFGSPIDCRRRLNPPLPENYLGNCLIFFMANSTHGRVKGDEGFAVALEAIAAAIRETVGNERGILDGFENHLKDLSEYEGKRVVVIAGSSRLDSCGADYGWGRAIKYECVHTDYDGAVNLTKGRDGGVEIGMSMTPLKMDAFAAAFHQKSYINSNL
ncbi:malonyl-coenzyme:anthocyanin 5-O-glucoside-6'''-O-malonyltransferase-like [Salvia miltiorrhiza]|uniref:malonyl-coenzyme:anthocyanin 5-O-glucoside-6'''-O-malonyltransferase-like n=1 Tax=Salvia miltiorrhiza TaxID=226208 RepID=UPI0025ABAF30|nr:malonyl-coenzyme:anthocyanin 5-O-glucoside-6'''-O-malonyltransferase-like [Salvia miltiorrhiza]